MFGQLFFLEKRTKKSRKKNYKKIEKKWGVGKTWLAYRGWCGRANLG
jgi:hypothetical protein